MSSDHTPPNEAQLAEGQRQASLRGSYLRLLRLVLRLCHGRFFIFMLLSVSAAFSEGFSVLMLAPILEPDGAAQAYSNNAVMRPLMNLFAGLSGADRILYAALSLIVLIVLRGVLAYSSLAVGGLLPIEIQRVLARKSYDLLLGARIGYVQRLSLGDVGNFLLHFPLRTAKSARSMADMFSNSVLVLSYLGILIIIAGPVALFALVFVGLIYFIIKRLTIARITQAGKTVSVKQSEINSLFVDSYQGISLLHLSRAENEFRARHGRAIEKLIKAMRQNVLLTVSYAPIMTTASGVLICLGLIGGSMVTDGSEGFISRMILFMVALYRMLSPVTAISAAHGTIQMQMDSFLKLETFFNDAEAARQPDGDQEIQVLEREIKFDNVQFGYEAGGDAVLNGVSFDIQKGQMVALVGPSGAGKSTILHLLTRMYDATHGTITVDGQPLERLRLSAWRKLIGVVSQDIVLFNDSVYNNLTIGLEGVSRDDVWAALEAAAARSFIENLPHGLATKLGERGSRLSGGQRQRLAIARAILSDPQILILDEATSHLDSETELAVQRLIEKFMNSKTVVVVAHRLATIRKADAIIVMQDGLVLERGTHDELVRQDSKYKYMLNNQLVDVNPVD